MLPVYLDQAPEPRPPGEWRLALTREGRMLAIRARIVADVGGYLMPTTAMPPRISRPAPGWATSSSARGAKGASSVI